MQAGEFETHNTRKRAAADPRLTARGHGDRHYDDVTSTKYKQTNKEDSCARLSLVSQGQTG